MTKIRFTASKAPAAVAAFQALTAAYGQADARRAEVIVALGGDGFMLQTLHAAHGRRLPVYGMNCGTIGFLMNAYALEDLPARLVAAGAALVDAAGRDADQHPDARGGVEACRARSSRRAGLAFRRFRRGERRARRAGAAARP